MNMGIKASTNYTPIIRALNHLVLTCTVILYSFHSLSIIHYDLVHNILLVFVSLMALFSIISIMHYNKRDIIKITQPSGMRGIGKSIKTFFSHPADLIIAPTLAIMITVDMISIGMDISLLTVGTVSFVLINVIQLSPLRIRKDMYLGESNKIISEELDAITMSRCIRQGIDRRSKEYKFYANRQITAEERMRVNSDFLTFSSGYRVMLTSLARFITPMIGTVGPMVIRMVFSL